MWTRFVRRGVLLGALGLWSGVTMAGTLPEAFHASRADAVTRLQRLEEGSFGSGVTAETSRWILTRRLELIEDVQKSEHAWMTGSSPVCARTTAAKLGKVLLYFSACETLKADERERTLIEQSIHHYGESSEAAVKRIATAIMTAKEAPEACAGEEMFSPGYCKSAQMTEKDALGWIDPPRIHSSVLGSARLAGRMRRCYKVGGCLPWRTFDQKTDPVFTELFDDNWGAVLKSVFRIQIDLRSDRPMLKVSGNFSTPIDTSKASGYFNRYPSLSSGFVPVPEALSSSVALTADGQQYYRSADGSVSSSSSTTSLKLALKSAKAAAFAGRVGRDCLWFQQTGSYPTTDGASNSYDVETELVLYGTFDR